MSDDPCAELHAFVDGTEDLCVLPAGHEGRHVGQLCTWLETDRGTIWWLLPLPHEMNESD